MKERVKKEIEYSDLMVESVRPHKYKEGRMQAQLKQIVTKTSKYPGADGSSDKQDALYEAEDFGEESNEFRSTQKRIAWIDVPNNSTIESVQTWVNKKYPEGTIYQIISYHIDDCITDGQMNMISNPSTELTLDKLKEKHLLKNNKKEPILKYGQKMYRALYFSRTRRADINHLNLDLGIEKEENAKAGDESEVA